MADLEEVVENYRSEEGTNLGYDDEKGSIRRDTSKRKRSKKRKDSGAPVDPAPTFTADQVHERKQEEDEKGSKNSHSEKEGELPADREDRQARFYQDYRKVAEEYDKDFLKKYDEDLNTTLIFAGLFSAVASAFIIQVYSQLQPDSGDDTAALLRVILYKIDNTSFGGTVPTVPQWTGPPAAMVDVQAILIASLSISLLAAFLAVLGKQWLNRYDESDMRGSTVERSQNRQRKLDGVVTWYFNTVMESLPLMLQGALLLLGCALSRYIWDTSITVASVVLAFTSFGLLFYLFIIVAATASESCPYQTPVSLLLRYLLPRLWSAAASVSSIFVSAIRSAIKESGIVGTVRGNAQYRHSWWSKALEIPRAFVVDVYHLGRATIRGLSAFSIGSFHLAREVYYRVHDIYVSICWRLDHRTSVLDLRCISWTLQTSLYKPVHLSTLNYLMTTTELTGLDPTLVVDCFNIFVGTITFNNRKVVVMPDLEQLAIVSATCFFRTLHDLSVTNPTSSTLIHLRERYDRIFPFDIDFRGLPFYNTIIKIHHSAHKPWNPRNSQWDDFKPTTEELIPFSRHVVEAAQEEDQAMRNKGGERIGELPTWISRFAYHFLSLDPQPPTPVVADCLTIVAIDLGCEVLDIMPLHDSARVEEAANVISGKLKTRVEAANPNDLTVVADCFYIFTFCVKVRDGKVVVVEGLDQLAKASATYFFRAFHNLSVADPSSGILTDLRKHYNDIFPPATDFRDIPFPHDMIMIDALVAERWNRRYIWWGKSTPLSDQEHISFARYMAEAAQAGYQRTQPRKVPRWTLRFALDSLTLDSPSPASVVADCLAIVAIDLGCDLLGVANLDESARVEEISRLITQKLETLVETTNQNVIFSKRKAISTVFPYAIFLERGGQQAMFDAILRAARASHSRGFIWDRIRPYIDSLFNEPNPSSLDRVIALISPYVSWDGNSHGPNTVSRWAVAASAIPYTEEVGQSVVGALLRIALVSPLQPFIPIDIWAWLKKRPALPPVLRGQSFGSSPYMVQFVRGLGDIELLKSYFLLVWSEWDYSPGVEEMAISIREDFGGMDMGHHRRDLLDRLDHVLEQLDRELDYFEQYGPWIGEDDIKEGKERYGMLKEVLLGVERKLMETLTQSHTTFNCALPCQ